MARRPKQPRLLRKVKIDGVWRFAAVPIAKSGRIDFEHVRYKGQLIACSTGTFHLDFRDANGRRKPTIGDDPADVRRVLATQAHVLELRRLGVEAEDVPEISERQNVSGPALASIVRDFRERPPARLGRKSAASYRLALEQFVEWARARRVTHLSQVTAELLERWAGDMRATLDASTVVNRATIVAVELRARGADVELERARLPKVTKRVRAMYSAEILDAFFAACNDREWLTYQTFLQSGMREREVACLGDEDVDEARSVLRVTRKPHLGFDLKNHEEREVRVPRWLTVKLLAYMRAASGRGGLVLGTLMKNGTKTGGKPDKKLLIKLKTIALRAGLNCGQCAGTWEGKPVTCATHPVCDRWFLHKFRHTYARQALRDGMDLVTLQGQLGHKDLETTRKYLEALHVEDRGTVVEESLFARRYGGQE